MKPVALVVTLVTARAVLPTCDALVVVPTDCCRPTSSTRRQDATSGWSRGWQRANKRQTRRDRGDRTTHSNPTRTWPFTVDSPPLAMTRELPPADTANGRAVGGALHAIHRIRQIDSGHPCPPHCPGLSHTHRMRQTPCPPNRLRREQPEQHSHVFASVSPTCRKPRREPVWDCAGRFTPGTDLRLSQ